MARERNPRVLKELELSSTGEIFYTTADGTPKGRVNAINQSFAKRGQVDTTVQRTTATSTFRNIAPNNVSVRDGFDRRDYDFFRPGERTPQNQVETISASLQAYNKIGIIHNFIDMMGDFVTQGVDVVHTNKSTEKWYKAWFKKINGKERTERIANILYRAATAVIQRHTAKIKVKDEDAMLRSVGGPNVKIKEPIKLAEREIPISYTIHNPLQVEVLGGDLSLFAGPNGLTYGLKVPPAMIRKVKFPKTAIEKELVANLPKEIRQGILDGQKVIPFNSDKITALYYKRDDWQVWATPMISPILPDLQGYTKMKMCDLAALDGAISHIRLWKLGSLEHELYPNEKVIATLADILSNNVGGGAIDLIWGPDIELHETDTSIHKFLGPQKYEAILNAIYVGLGIPPALTGSSGAGKGTSSNFISLRTLIERLQYVRDLIINFWNFEIRLVQQAMGFRKPAELVFERMSLTDEAAEQQLYLNLWDRDIISTEFIQERFGATPEIEFMRLQREAKMRKDKELPAKASPFHTAQEDFNLEKIFAQTGQITPGELGLELNERQPGEKTLVEIQSEADKLKAKQMGAGKPKGQPGQGRPSGKKDSKKRKKKPVKTKVVANLMDLASWAEQTQKTITELATPTYLKAQGKKNRRQLTVEEFNNFEKFTFAALCNTSVLKQLDKDRFGEVLKGSLTVPKGLLDGVKRAVGFYQKKEGKELSVERVRQIQSQVYAVYKYNSVYGSEEIESQNEVNENG